MKSMSKNNRGKRKIRKDEVTEDDFCFTCKDGGLLLLCDHENCLRAYHPDCVGRGDEFLNSGKRWICGLHFCFGCLRSPQFSCMCCSKAFCSDCVAFVKFVEIKAQKGLCRVCLKLALFVEENADDDSDAPSVAFFRKFWMINNKKECLTLEDLRSAHARMKKGGQAVLGRDSSRGIKIGSNNDDGSGQLNYQSSAAKVTKGDQTICISSSSKEGMRPTNIDGVHMKEMRALLQRSQKFAKETEALMSSHKQY